VSDLGDSQTQGIPIRSRGLAILAVFVCVQILDALLTWNGLKRFGAAAEGNPILSFYISFFGAAPALGVAKGLAMCGGGLLCFKSRHVILSILTLVYIVGAVVPWLWLLWA
jgi:hypothetical protein